MQDGVFIGGGSVFHQHVRVGRLAIVQGRAGFGKDIPPFTLGRRGEYRRRAERRRACAGRASPRSSGAKSSAPSTSFTGAASIPARRSRPRPSARGALRRRPFSSLWRPPKSAAFAALREARAAATKATNSVGVRPGVALRLLQLGPRQEACQPGSSPSKSPAAMRQILLLPLAASCSSSPAAPPRRTRRPGT